MDLGSAARLTSSASSLRICCSSRLRFGGIAGPNHRDHQVRRQSSPTNASRSDGGSRSPSSMLKSKAAQRLSILTSSSEISIHHQTATRSLVTTAGELGDLDDLVPRYRQIANATNNKSA